MSSVFRLEPSQTSSADVYDHSIGLVDSTKPIDEIIDSGDALSDSVVVPVSAEGSVLNRQWTRPHLRKELARRKYAKWQEEAEEEDVVGRSVNANGENTNGSKTPPQQPTKHGTLGIQGRLRDYVPFRSGKKQSRAASKNTSFIDVLYENQRGFFLCGIPVYSANSLLNLDPSGWQTAVFQDSAVNITNAQVPDPSWVWDWRSWYVDMSHDVDEEGWEYSLSFSPNFAWHGNHPWFHSFCRRRRWLRKRVKIDGRVDNKREERGSRDGHRLTADYFTIHAARRDRSRSTSGDRSATRGSSTVAGYQATEDDEEELKEIPDLSTLIIAMKRARVDREKISAITQFLQQGGDEIFYLSDKILAFMDDFVHQTSRRQMQHYLLAALESAIRAKDRNDEDEPDQKKANERRIDNLLKTINTAGVHVNDQDYWSDIRTRAINEEKDPADQTYALDAAGVPKVEARDDVAQHIETEGGLGDEIKGISKDAELSVEPGIRRPKAEVEHSEEKPLDKGKGKEKA